jgi:hypothetical protein
VKISNTLVEIEFGRRVRLFRASLSPDGPVIGGAFLIDKSTFSPANCGVFFFSARRDGAKPIETLWNPLREQASAIGPQARNTSADIPDPAPAATAQGTALPWRESAPPAIWAS